MEKIRNTLKTAFFMAVNLPVISSLYSKIYINHIRKKIEGLKVSDITVSVEPNNVCNSQCVMCPYHKMTRKKEIMSMELFQKIIDDCVGCGVKKFNLNFYNEPFLDPFIFDRIKYLKSKGVRTQLFSNGSVLDDEKINKILESGLNDLKFSIDAATKETYEKIRIGLVFEKTVSNIESLVSRKKELGCNGPKISLVFVRQKLNESEVDDFKLYWENKVDNIIISFDDNRNDTSSFLQKENLIPYPCRKLWTELAVTSDGKVVLCCVDYDGKIIQGDFNTQYLKEIWEGQKLKYIRDLHLNFKANQIDICKNCVHPYRMNLTRWWYGI